MRNVSAAFMRALSADKRDWNNRAVITLADNTVLNLDNEDIWDDGVSIEDAVSRDNVFDVGAAIINQAKLVINNIYDTYSTYDFTGARVVLYTGLSDLDDGSTEEIKLGTYTVDDPQYNGSIITLTCLDNMYKFDEAYDTSLIYPATLGEIVRDCCTNCGVTMDNASLQFPHYDYVVDAKPSSESTTYRQVISWAAQIAGCFARCNANGYLTIKWYDTAALDEILQNLDGGIFDNGTPKYITGDSADGGSFNPWNTGAVYDGGALNEARKVHQISSDYSCHISTDDVVITGVKVVKKVVSEDTQSDFEEYTSGSAGYVISIEDNDLIQGTHGQDIANWLGTALIGLVFRKAEITHPSNPSIEAGDVALYWDRKANYYSIIVSSTNFTSSNSQTTRSSAETPRKNSAQRFTESTKNYVELRKRIKMQRTAWQQAEDDLIERINNSNGLYVTEVVESGATKIYYHDKPNLNESSIVMYFSDVGFTLTSNYQDNPPTWYGMTVDGTMIAGIMNTIGINFDWGVGGALQIKNGQNERFYANADTGVVRIVADSFSLSNGDTINSIANSAASSAVNGQTQTDIFNKLTNNGQTQGIYLSNSKIYINASYISSGTFTVKKGNVTTFSANASTGVVNIVADSFSLSNGDTINSIAQSEAKTVTKNLTSRYATCSTAAATVAKSTGSTPANFELYNGASISVYFSNANTAANPTLNVNSTGAKSIYVRGAAITAKDYWTAGSLCEFVYNGSQWVMSAESQTETFNRLTAGGTSEGIYLSGGHLYVNASMINTGTLSATYISGGTLKLGGNNNVNGSLQILDSSNAQIGKWDSSGITISKGSISIGSNFSVTSTGALTASGASLNGTFRTTSNGIYTSIKSGKISIGTVSNGSDTETGSLYVHSDPSYPGMDLRTSGLFQLYAGTTTAETSSLAMTFGNGHGYVSLSNYEHWFEINYNEFRFRERTGISSGTVIAYIDSNGLHSSGGATTSGKVYLPASPPQGVSYYTCDLVDGILK